MSASDTSAPVADFLFPVGRWSRGCLLAWLVTGSGLDAAELRVSVGDTRGAPVSDAVVAVELLEAAEAPPSAPSAARTAVIAQRNEQFEPFVTAIQTGTAVSFPNQDEILHNVYSFSTAKKFQLPLYRDKAPPPVVFDQPGTVILGCNIHDWMVAYVYVVDTPYFAKTGADGTATMAELPAGRYRVQAFHPRKRKRGSTAPVTLELAHAQPAAAEFVIALKPEWRPRHGAARPDYRD